MSKSFNQANSRRKKAMTLQVESYRDDKDIKTAIPYTFPLGCATVIGILYLKDPIQESYTDGVFAGCVNGSYRIDQHDPEAWADGGLFKIGIKIDFGGHKLFGQFCNRDWTGRWQCHGWKEILHW
jgi:hypothetical protein